MAMPNFEYLGYSASFISVLRYSEMRKIEKKNQENEKIEINYFNTDHLIVSK